MLKRLDISNFALIENVNLEFNSGFSVITGETGAGKSILLKALNLLLGERADYSVINQSEQKCVIEAEFDINGIIDQTIFDELNLDFEANTIIRREFNLTGKSRIFVNDTPASLNALKILGEKLINIHSQHQTLQLFDNKFQLEVFDIFAQHKKEVENYQSHFNQYINLKKDLIELKNNDANNRKERDYAMFLLNELSELNLDDINISELESENKIIENWSTIKTTLDNVTNIFDTPNTSPIDGINNLLTAFHDIKDLDTAYNELLLRLNSVKIELQDIQSEIESKADHDDLDEEKSVAIKEKIESINKLLFKHNVDSIEELITIKNNLEGQLESFNSVENEIKSLEIEIESTEKRLIEVANKIHENRLNHKTNFENTINDSLTELAMPNASINVQIEKTNGLTVNGFSELKLLFKTNLGGSYLEIKKTASGGELSRLMLSILSVIGQLKKLPTMIFDEIDTGVSGEVASKMANVFKKLGQDSQLISITHLPQIAGKGSHHFHVYKADSENKTRTKVKALNNDERVLELAKMMSGETITTSAKENAKQLLENE